MRLDIDDELGVAYLYVQPEGTPVKNTLADIIANLDFDENENLIGIELLGWKKNEEEGT